MNLKKTIENINFEIKIELWIWIYKRFAEIQIQSSQFISQNCANKKDGRLEIKLKDLSEGWNIRWDFESISSRAYVEYEINSHHIVGIM